MENQLLAPPHRPHAPRASRGARRQKTRPGGRGKRAGRVTPGRGGAGGRGEARGHVEEVRDNQRRSSPSSRRLAPTRPVRTRAGGGCRRRRRRRARGQHYRTTVRAEVGGRARRGGGVGRCSWKHRTSFRLPYAPRGIRGEEQRPARYENSIFQQQREEKLTGRNNEVLRLCPVQMSFLSRNLIAQSTAAVTHPNTRTGPRAGEF